MSFKKCYTINMELDEFFENMFETLGDFFETFGELTEDMACNFDHFFHKMKYKPYREHCSTKIKMEENKFILSMLKEEKISSEEAETLLKVVNNCNNVKREEILIILNMFGDNKISFDDAVRLLKAL